MGRFRKYAKKQGKRLWGAVKKRYGTSGGFSRLASDVKMLKTLVNTEHKYTDQAISSSTFTQTTPFTLELNRVEQGVDNIQRTGNSIKQTSLQIRMRMERASTATGCNYCRVMIVNDREPIAGTFTLTDLLTTQTVHSLRNFNYANSNRYQVLMDKVYTIDGVKTSTVMVDLYRKLNLHTRFNGSTFSAHVDNRLWLVVIPDFVTAGEVSLNGQTRIKYIDN